MGSKKTYGRGEITIVLADDDSDDVLFFEQALQEINLPHKLHIASNGQQLIEDLTCADLTPDIIFLDINMPFKNGMETLIEVRNALMSPVPVVMLSTAASLTLIKSSQMLGASAYICKPSSFPALCLILSRLLARQEFSRSAQEFDLPHFHFVRFLKQFADLPSVRRQVTLALVLEALECDRSYDQYDWVLLLCSWLQIKEISALTSTDNRKCFTSGLW